MTFFTTDINSWEYHVDRIFIYNLKPKGGPGSPFEEQGLRPFRKPGPPFGKQGSLFWKLGPSFGKQGAFFHLQIRIKKIVPPF